VGESSIGWLHPPLYGRRAPYGTPGMPGYTVNHWIGCQRVDPECENCYAEREAGRGRLPIFKAQNLAGLPVWGPKAPRHIVGAGTLANVARWHREAQGLDHHGRPIEGAIPWERWVFGGSQMDWLEDRPELAEPRARMMATIERTGPWLRWILLTKRPQNFARLAPAWAERGCPGNVWFGISAGSQRSLDRQIEAFASVNATHKLISGEPLIGPVDFRPALRLPGVKWLILGGESGSRSSVRPCDVHAIRDGIDAARAAGRAVFVKQLGAVVLGVPDCAACEGDRFEGDVCEACGDTVLLRQHGGEDEYRRILNLKHIKGEDPREWPADLRVQEWPDGSAYLHEGAT